MVVPAAGARARLGVRAALALLVLAAAPLGARAAEAPCPPSVPSLVRAETLDEVAAHVRAREPVRIVAIGSSSTEGIGATAPERAYPAQLEGYLRDLWKLDSLRVENLGKAGETADETLARLKAVLGTGPDLVIWQVGTNDAVKGSDEDRFRALLVEGIEAAREKDVAVVLLDPQYFPGIKDQARYERFVRIIRRAGREEGVSVFSRYTLMKNWNAHSAEDLRAMLAGDSFHMSDRGYACLTRSLGGALATLVPAAPAMARR